MYNKYGRWLASLIMVQYLTGCFLLPPRTPRVISAKRSNVFVYRVASKEETFGGVVERLTGSRENWPKVLKFNRGLKVEKVTVGSNIKLPYAYLRPGLRYKFKKQSAPKKPSAKPIANKEAISPPKSTEVNEKLAAPKIKPPKDHLEVLPLTTELDSFDESEIKESVIRDPANPIQKKIAPEIEEINPTPLIEMAPFFSEPVINVAQPTAIPTTQSTPENQMHKQYETLMEQLDQE